MELLVLKEIQFQPEQMKTLEGISIVQYIMKCLNE